MKNHQFLIFFSIVFTIYFLGNLYIFIKGYNSIPGAREHRILYFTAFILLASMFVIGKILETNHSSVFSDILNITGGFWLAFMLYAFLFLLLTDITVPILKLTGVVGPESLPEIRKWSFYGTTVLSLLLIAGGFINAVIPKVTEYNVTIEKKTDGVDNLRIVAVSDIHLGSIIRKRSMRKLSAMMHELKPEAVFLLGDIVDGEMGPVLRGDLLQYFDPPESVDGLFAITGNHEFIGNAGRTIPYIESHGIRVLKDEMVVLPGGVQLIGRIDRDSRRHSLGERLPLGEIMKDADHTRPLIVLDHQPVKLEEAEKAGVDLQLSGHTHNGQFWPLNLITKRLYEVSYGYLRKGSSQFIVSSGFGLWGPRIRSGSRPEVLLINVSFSR
ncbi:MAG: metallophosphoesterase [Bacteroidales bacterium]|nr:metallophosphoesterase [Bacteroidales bacterium]MBN2632899.1 metallophosphoesterase [Bacteroidales bacterium]